MLAVTVTTEKDMAVCTYDNPATMARECWQDGELICHYAFQLLPPFAKEPIPTRHFFFGANIGPWKLGQMVGDAVAMTANAKVSGPGIVQPNAEVTR